MSVHLITVIPIDPFWVPDPVHEAAAVAVADEILVDRRRFKSSGPPRYPDAGKYQNGARCPACAAALDTGWWRTQILGVIEGDEFGPLDVTMPCCGRDTTVNDILSDPPEGFASWSIEATDPEHGWLDAEDQARIESALGRPVRIVLTRY